MMLSGCISEYPKWLTVGQFIDSCSVDYYDLRTRVIQVLNQYSDYLHSGWFEVELHMSLGFSFNARGG